MTKQEIDKLVKARKDNPNAGRAALMKATGISEMKCRRWLKKNCLQEVDACATSNHKTLSDFRQVYDKSTIVPKAIKSALKDLGQSGWEYEVQFAKMAGISLVDIANFREMFADYIVSIKRDNKRVWAGSVSTANEMRSMV